MTFVGTVLMEKTKNFIRYPVKVFVLIEHGEMVGDVKWFRL
jgi:hypothetical protein